VDTRPRGLTTAEYLGSLRDLLFLADVQPVAAVAPPSLLEEGFENDAETVKIDSDKLDRLDKAATLAIDIALSAGSASRRRLLSGCEPVAQGCARKVVSDFAGRAWRRSVDNADVDRLMTALSIAAGQGDPIEQGLKLALRMVLVSPNFLYRVELDGTSELHPIGPHDLATRLSYFLWASTPDSGLLERAASGTLRDPKVLSSEITRMLADKKAQTLVDSFAAQWLMLGKLAFAEPHATKFPAFNEALRHAMESETLQFVRAFLNLGGTEPARRVTDLFEADFTFANDVLAKHYGLPAMSGSSMRKVVLTGTTERFGLLTHASGLTAFSVPERTSPTRRGLFVLSRLLCTPIPPPPPDVDDALDETPAGVVNPTIRTALAAHVNKASCKGCHESMDAIGLAFEHYDAIGRYRAAYPGGTAIDATGVLPGDVRFNGARELSRVLKSDPRFASCFVRSMFSYALGRDGSAPADLTTIARLTDDFVRGGAHMKDLIPQIVASPAFTHRGQP
jgi:hypothetical protein